MKWPLVVIDNFYPYANLLVDFANEQEYVSGTNYPGYRTDPLHQLNHPLFNAISDKIVAALYPYEHYSMQFNCTSYFQKVPANLIDGWVHQDKIAEVTAILYLSTSMNAGTSLYTPLIPFPECNAIEKNEYFQKVNNKKELSAKKNEEYTKLRDVNNSNFIKSIYIEDIRHKDLSIRAHGDYSRKLI